MVDFVHAETDAKICAADRPLPGPKGSTQLGWEESDAPLQAGNWPMIVGVARCRGRQRTRRRRR